MSCWISVNARNSVVLNRDRTYAAGLFFLSNTDEKRLQTRPLRGVEHLHGTGAGGDHPAVGEADPLASVFFEELVTDGPVPGLILATVWVNLPCDLGWKLVNNALHRLPRVCWNHRNSIAIRRLRRPLRGQRSFRQCSNREERLHRGGESGRLFQKLLKPFFDPLFRSFFASANTLTRW
jgi:hypothetical protein